jgi:hypothetical protein
MNIACEYLVHHGAAGHVGRFRAAVACAPERGDAVVVRTSRGLELGEVLRLATLERASFPDPFVGELLRPATADDVAAAARYRELGRIVAGDAERLAAERGLPLAVLDVEILLDGRQAVPHVLKLAACDEGPWLAELGERHGLIARVYDLAREAPPSEAAEEGGCSSCGSGGCGSGECGSCGTGGCSSCSSGAGKELMAYFAELREQMERRQRVPLL